MNDSDLARHSRKSTTPGRVALRVFLFFAGLFILSQICIGPPMTGIHRARESTWLQAAHTLALASFSYANDHDQKYPDGQSSTEIFQKLLDGKYLTDPGIFYVPLPGKVKALADQKLKPENVGWDFTVRKDHSGLDPSDSDLIPVVYLTGFKLSFVREGVATSLIKPYRIRVPDEQSWLPWAWRTISGPSGIAVAYKNNGAKFILVDDQGMVPRVISAEFDDTGKVFLQLTPDGSLP